MRVTWRTKRSRPTLCRAATRWSTGPMGPDLRTSEAARIPRFMKHELNTAILAGDACRESPWGPYIGYSSLRRRKHVGKVRELDSTDDDVALSLS